MLETMQLLMMRRSNRLEMLLREPVAHSCTQYSDESWEQCHCVLFQIYVHQVKFSDGENVGENIPERG